MLGFTRAGGLRGGHARVRGGEAARMTRFAVVGHVEWIEFGRFTHVPEPGEIIDATEWFSEAAGSAAVVAVQLAKLSGDVDFFTALGNDERGRRAARAADRARRARPRRARATRCSAGASSTSTTTASARSRSSGSATRPTATTTCRGSASTAPTPSSSPAATTRPCARPGARELLVATPRAVESLAGVQLDALVGSRQGPARAGRPRHARPGPEAGHHDRRQGRRDLARGRAARGPLRGRRAARAAGRRLRRRRHVRRRRSPTRSARATRSTPRWPSPPAPARRTSPAAAPTPASSPPTILDRDLRPGGRR